MMKYSQLNLPASYPAVVAAVVQVTGNKQADVTPQSDLVLDLGLNFSTTFPLVIANLNQQYLDEELDLKVQEVKEELEAGQMSVLELAQIVQEACELG